MRRGDPKDLGTLVTMQEAAYAPNFEIIGATPTPLTWDYADIIARYEVWLAEDIEGLCGALILEPLAHALYIQSIAVAPRAKGRGVGNRMLVHAEERALAARLPALRLTANARMVFNVDWYGRKGFLVESIETVGERQRVHMIKMLDSQQGLVD